MYLGKYFSVTIRYSSEFADYDGYARSFYIHTWKDSYIEDITFTGSRNDLGVSISIRYEDQAFKIFNNSDTPF